MEVKSRTILERIRKIKDQKSDEISSISRKNNTFNEQFLNQIIPISIIFIFISNG
jgi:hypothetical protein